MACTGRCVTLGLLLCAPVLLAQNLISRSPRAFGPGIPQRTAPNAQPQLALPLSPSGPLSQLPMNQIPAAPAQVSYQGGLLTISAQNSSLAEILRGVRKLTGASIEIPQGSGANERVVVNLGPGAPRDVLAALLNGSAFNYVMLGSSSDPTALSSVILTARPSETGETQTAANVTPYESPAPMPPTHFPGQPFRQQLLGLKPGGAQPGAGQTTAGNDDSKDDDDKDDDDSADDQAQAQPGQADATDANAQVQPDPNQPNAGPKTPEQIMEMLRKQQPGAAVLNPPPPPPQQ